MMKLTISGLFGRLKRGIQRTRDNGFSILELIMTILFVSITVPAVIAMYTNVSIASLDAEIMSVANNLATEQMEKILCDKAGTGAGYGYAAITSARYASVPTGVLFPSYTRTVTVTAIDLGSVPGGGGGTYPAKLIVVTVSQPMIPNVVLKGFVCDHAGL
jgi:hypothetical protein